MFDLSLPAPAKLNLFLHINGRRPDGYHELQTLFQLVDWCDLLHFQKRNDSGIDVEMQYPTLAKQDNLVFKAATLLQQQSHCTQGADILLEKHLPMGAGIGGGSSDAATTLIALNQLWGLDWSPEQLAELGRQLGADVPVFILGKTAFAEGIGEKLTPIALAKRWYVIVTPDCPIDTKTIFQADALPRNTAKIDYKDIQDPCIGQNDCQDVVLAHYPAVGKVFAELLEYGTPRLTGTGCCLFMDFPTQAAAQAVHQKIGERYTCVTVSSLNTSPAYGSDRTRVNLTSLS